MVADGATTTSPEVVGVTCWFADREVLESVVGHPIPADIWTFVPWGHRLVVVREDPAETSAGGIIIPSVAKRPYTRGWVISAGHQVGEPSVHYPNACPLHGSDLIGRKVMFGNFAGTVLAPDTEFGPRGTHEGMYVVLYDADLFGELINNKPEEPK